MDFNEIFPYLLFVVIALAAMVGMYDIGHHEGYNSGFISGREKGFDEGYEKCATDTLEDIKEARRIEKEEVKNGSRQ